VSYHEKLRKLLHRRTFQGLLVLAEPEYLFAALAREPSGQIAVEFVFQQRNPILPAATVTDGIFNRNFVRTGAIFEEYLEGIGD
jgi:hypothetical protein